MDIYVTFINMMWKEVTSSKLRQWVFDDLFESCSLVEVYTYRGGVSCLLRRVEDSAGH